MMKFYKKKIAGILEFKTFSLMYPDMLLLTPEFSFLPSVFRKPVTAKKSSYTVRVRNPWFALFGLTNHKLHYGNSSIPLRILDL